MAAGFDVTASLSGSSSATSGADVKNTLGDFIVGGKAKTPPYLLIAAILGAVVVAIVLLRR